MLYLNQNDYPDLKYPTNAKDPSSASYLNGTVASSGCGLCCLCMAVDRLSLRKLTLRQCLRMAIRNRANMSVGTSMKILGPLVADKYGLSCRFSNSEDELADCLRNGGCVIVNVGGDHDDHIGVFSDVGHYIICVGMQGEYVRVLDPAYRKGKYDIEGRKGKVIDTEGILYTLSQVLHDDTENRTPRYYLFNREVNKNEHQ